MHCCAACPGLSHVSGCSDSEYGAVVEQWLAGEDDETHSERNLIQWYLFHHEVTWSIMLRNQHLTLINGMPSTWMHILYHILLKYVLSKLAQAVMLLTCVWEMSVKISTETRAVLPEACHYCAKSLQVKLYNHLLSLSSTYSILSCWQNC